MILKTQPGEETRTSVVIFVVLLPPTTHTQTILKGFNLFMVSCTGGRLAVDGRQFFTWVLSFLEIQDQPQRGPVQIKSSCQVGNSKFLTMCPVLMFSKSTLARKSCL
jgi:hypothetical protein